MRTLATSSAWGNVTATIIVVVVVVIVVVAGSVVSIVIVIIPAESLPLRECSVVYRG